jgi:hypothetical protein
VATGDEHDSTSGWIAGSPPNDEPPRSVSARYPGAGESSSFRARLTLGLAVLGSILLVGGTLLFLQFDGPSGSDTPAVALPGPWEPPSVPAGAPSDPVPASPPVSGAVTPPTGATPPVTGEGEGGEGDGGGEAQPPGTTAPPGGPTAAPPATTRPPAQPSGPNLSLGADSDGSSKAADTSFGNVQDGSLATFWSPKGTTTGEISIKWGSSVTLSRINIREASGGGTIRSWRVRNYDTGTVLATGSGAGTITFARTTLRKITFEILSATGVPRVAEFETFAN